MRKLILLSLIALTLISCKKNQDGPEPEDIILEDLYVNFYRPTFVGEELNVPQLTIKTDETQITAIGNNYNGVQDRIRKVYISDLESNTEWILLLDKNIKPKYLYQINSFTKEKLPLLYAFEDTSAWSYILRLYGYDWLNRLGTLNYEVNIDENNTEVVFDNPSATPFSANSRMSASSTVPNKALSGNSKSRRAFSAPRAGEETIDEQFDRKAGELIDLLKETKIKLINAPCNVSKILNKADKKFACKLTDQVNKITNERVLSDLSSANQSNNIDKDFEYEGEGFKLNIGFFNSTAIKDNLGRHLNDIKNTLPDDFKFEDWIGDLAELNEVEIEDLDDLTDKDGVVHIGLNWDTSVDLDLRVTDPKGEIISHENKTSASGGYLDREDLDGFGPENIYWMKAGPNGVYRAQVYYNGPTNGPTTHYTIKIINGLGFQRQLSGMLFPGDTRTVVFRKNGSDITLL